VLFLLTFSCGALNVSSHLRFPSPSLVLSVGNSRCSRFSRLVCFRSLQKGARRLQGSHPSRPTFSPLLGRLLFKKQWDEHKAASNTLSCPMSFFALDPAVFCSQFLCARFTHLSSSAYSVRTSSGAVKWERVECSSAARWRAF